MSDANLIGKVMTSLSASAKSDGSLSQLIATNGIGTNFLALESADESARSAAQSAFKVTRTSISALLGKHFKLALESEDGSTIEGNSEAGVEDGREAMLTQAQLQAGAITAAALENPAEYGLNVRGAGYMLERIGDARIYKKMDRKLERRQKK